MSELHTRLQQREHEGHELTAQLAAVRADIGVLSRDYQQSETARENLQKVRRSQRVGNSKVDAHMMGWPDPREYLNGSCRSWSSSSGKRMLRSRWLNERM